VKHWKPWSSCVCGLYIVLLRHKLAIYCDYLWYILRATNFYVPGLVKPTVEPHDGDFRRKFSLVYLRHQATPAIIHLGLSLIICHAKAPDCLPGGTSSLFGPPPLTMLSVLLCLWCLWLSSVATSHSFFGLIKVALQALWLWCCYMNPPQLGGQGHPDLTFYIK